MFPAGSIDSNSNCHLWINWSELLSNWYRSPLAHPTSGTDEQKSMLSSPVARVNERRAHFVSDKSSTLESNEFYEFSICKTKLFDSWMIQKYAKNAERKCKKYIQREPRSWRLLFSLPFTSPPLFPFLRSLVSWKWTQTRARSPFAIHTIGGLAYCVPVVTTAGQYPIPHRYVCTIDGGPRGGGGGESELARYFINK